MKVKLYKDGKIICYRRGWKTLITTDTEVDNKVFEAKASFCQTIHCFLSSNDLMNYVTIALFMTLAAFLVFVTVPKLRMLYIGVYIKISISMPVIFIFLLVYRYKFYFGKFLENNID